MIAYRRFIPREIDDELAASAKAANLARVETGCEVPLAKPLLEPAKAADFSQTLAELSQPKSAQISRLSKISRFSRACAEETASAPPRAWVDGIEQLACMSCPAGYRPSAWDRAILDAEQFMDRWAAQAMALGWRDWEVWGVHRKAPWYRLEGRGLVPSLEGSKIGALTVTEAVIVRRSGARLTFRRRPHDPLHPNERALLWELE